MRRISLPIMRSKLKNIWSCILKSFSLRIKRRCFSATGNPVLRAGRLVERYHWKIGDIITLKGTYIPGNCEFVLRGIYYGKYETTDERAFVFHWEYMNEVSEKERVLLCGSRPGFYMVGSEGSEPLRRRWPRRLTGTLRIHWRRRSLRRKRLLSSLSSPWLEAIIMAIQMVSFVDHHHHYRRGGQHHGHDRTGTDRRIRHL